MDYPAIPFSLASTESVADDIQLDRAMDGRGRARMFYTEPKATWSLLHVGVSLDDVQTLRGFYAAQRGTVVTIYYGCPPVAHSGLALQPPQVTHLGGGLYQVAQQMAQFP